MPLISVFAETRGIFVCARYWVRTSDLFGVNEARYHCANRAYITPRECDDQSNALGILSQRGMQLFGPTADTPGTRFGAGVNHRLRLLVAW